MHYSVEASSVSLSFAVMASCSGGFAFDDDFVDLATISEESSGDDSSRKSMPPPSPRPPKAGATELLAEEAEKNMKEAESLLKKMRSSTATREEKARLKSLNAKLSHVNKDLAKAAASAERDGGRREDAELAILRAEAKHKTDTLLKAWKDKQVRSVIREVCFFRTC